MIWLTKPGIAAKLIITFIIIGTMASVLLAVVGTSFLKAALFDSLDTKSKLLTHYLAHELVEPLTKGEYDRMQRIMKAEQKLDSSLSYATVITEEGRVLATTDKSLKNVKVTLDSVEKSAFKMRTFAKLQMKNPNVIETEMPLALPAGEERTILKVGYSTTAPYGQILALVLSLIGLELLILVTGAAIYSLITRKIILQPISRVAKLAAQISQGDLSETLYSNRSDEIGCLIRAEAEMVKNLRKFASVADEIAGGNLSVHIDVHSEKDVFGKALEKMVESLNSRIKEARKLAAIAWWIWSFTHIRWPLMRQSMCEKMVRWLM
jgi:methyl-accepting chemotaxis protein